MARAHQGDEDCNPRCLQAWQHPKKELWGSEVALDTNHRGWSAQG